MIPSVLLIDLTFAAVVLWLRGVAPSRLTRGLCTAMVVYVLIEAAFHVPMENAVATVWGG